MSRARTRFTESSRIRPDEGERPARGSAHCPWAVQPLLAISRDEARDHLPSCLQSLRAVYRRPFETA
jgi:hypothetical protein